MPPCEPVPETFKSRQNHIDRWHPMTSWWCNLKVYKGRLENMSSSFRLQGLLCVKRCCWQAVGNAQRKPNGLRRFYLCPTYWTPDSTHNSSLWRRAHTNLPMPIVSVFPWERSALVWLSSQGSRVQCLVQMELAGEFERGGDLFGSSQEWAAGIRCVVTYILRFSSEPTYSWVVDGRGWVDWILSANLPLVCWAVMEPAADSCHGSTLRERQCAVGLTIGFSIILELQWFPWKSRGLVGRNKTTKSRRITIKSFYSQIMEQMYKRRLKRKSK